MRYYLCDRIVAFTPFESVRAVKNVSLSEDFFRDHFDGFPIMPGALILEALSQACGAFVELSLQRKLDYFPKVILSIAERLKFRRMVFPGDSLVLEGQALSVKEDAARVAASAWVKKELVLETTLTYACMRLDHSAVEQQRRSVLAIWIRDLDGQDGRL